MSLMGVPGLVRPSLALTSSLLYLSSACAFRAKEETRDRDGSGWSLFIPKNNTRPPMPYILCTAWGDVPVSRWNSNDTPQVPFLPSPLLFLFLVLDHPLSFLNTVFRTSFVFSSLFIYNFCIVFFADSHSFFEVSSAQAYIRQASPINFHHYKAGPRTTTFRRMRLR